MQFGFAQAFPAQPPVAVMGPTLVPLLLPEPAPEPAPALLPEPAPELAPEPLRDAPDEPLPPPAPFPLPLPPPLPEPVPDPFPPVVPPVAVAPEPLALAGACGLDEQLPSTMTPATHAPIANKVFGFMEFTRVRMLNGCSRRFGGLLSTQKRDAPGKTHGHRQGVSHVGEMQSCIMFHNGPASGGKQPFAQSSESVAPSGPGAASMSKLPPSGNCPL
jgi:hypothetical protein